MIVWTHLPVRRSFGTIYACISPQKRQTASLASAAITRISPVGPPSSTGTVLPLGYSSPAVWEETPPICGQRAKRNASAALPWPKVCRKMPCCWKQNPPTQRKTSPLPGIYLPKRASPSPLFWECTSPIWSAASMPPGKTTGRRCPSRSRLTNRPWQNIWRPTPPGAAPAAPPLKCWWATSSGWICMPKRDIRFLRRYPIPCGVLFTPW